MIKTYYHLTKPGIIYGNLLTAVGGFLLASKGAVDSTLFLATCAGIALVIASGCVFNNYIDRHIDKKMARTKDRAIVSGLISPRNALFYGTVLGIAGFTVLALYTNVLTVIIGMAGLFFYVIAYSVFKRSTVYGTEVGSISGALPVVAGYTAVTNQIDLGAVILFLVLVFWQMPHFYAIAMYRSKDYAAAEIPVLPVKKGIHRTKLRILLYVVAFGTAVATLALFGFAGYVYAVVMAIISLIWLHLAVMGFRARDDNAWARKMFRFSLISLLAFSFMISIDSLLI